MVNNFKRLNGLDFIVQKGSSMDSSREGNEERRKEEKEGRE